MKTPRATTPAWHLRTCLIRPGDLLEQGVRQNGEIFYPASYENLIRVKNLFQEADPNCSVFPTVADLGRSTLGIGARFTTLHWDGVDKPCPASASA